MRIDLFFPQTVSLDNYHMYTILENLEKMLPYSTSCRNILLYYKANPDRFNPMTLLDNILITLLYELNRRLVDNLRVRKVLEEMSKNEIVH